MQSYCTQSLPETDAYTEIPEKRDIAAAKRAAAIES